MEDKHGFLNTSKLIYINNDIYQKYSTINFKCDDTGKNDVKLSNYVSI